MSHSKVNTNTSNKVQVGPTFTMYATNAPSTLGMTGKAVP